MAATVLARTTDLTREQWLELRRRGIGSSDASVILGLNPWTSPRMLWLDKLGLLDEKPDNLRMRVGREMEALVAKLFAEESGYRVQRRNAMLQHSEHPFMLANLDREFFHPEHGRCPLEIKTTDPRNADQWADGQAPFHYQIQLLHQLAVTGAPYGCLAVLLGNSEFKIVEMHRDDALISDYLIPAEQEFWRLVETQEPPPWSGTDAEEELLQRMQAKVEPGKTTILPAEALQWREEYRQAHEEMKAAEARKKAARLRLKEAMGDAEEGWVEGKVIVTYPEIRPRKFDEKGFQAAHPGLHSEWLKESPYRRLNLKK